MSIVVIEDERHAEWHGKFLSMEDAIAELQLRADIPWYKKPNTAPCTNWRNCGRKYELVEYDDTSTPWKVVNRVAALNVSAEGVFWVLPKDLQDED